MTRYRRRQRVVMRYKQRRAAATRAWQMLAGLGILAGGWMAGRVAAVHGRPLVDRHFPPITPEIRVEGPLAVNPVGIRGFFPAGQRWWIPGIDWTWQRKIQTAFPQIDRVRIERYRSKKRVAVLIQTRAPFIRYASQGFDSQGQGFPLDSVNNASALPQLLLGRGQNASVWSRRLAGLAQADAPGWARVTLITVDPEGRLRLQRADQSAVEWGIFSPETWKENLRWLHVVQKDAAERLGGSALIDLTLFSEGRIIVRPRE